MAYVAVHIGFAGGGKNLIYHFTDGKEKDFLQSIRYSLMGKSHLNYMIDGVDPVIIGAKALSDAYIYTVEHKN